jgi:hypothetical protein
VDLGEHAAVLVCDHGRRSDMERETDCKGVSVYLLHGDKITPLEFHFDHQEGIAAVGLPDRGY